MDEKPKYPWLSSIPKIGKKMEFCTYFCGGIVLIIIFAAIIYGWFFW